MNVDRLKMKDRLEAFDQADLFTLITSDKIEILKGTGKIFLLTYQKIYSIINMVQYIFAV